MRDAGWHNNGTGPLYKDGRLFNIKVNHVEAVDAYNGISLWQRELPGANRFSPGREGGPACLDEHRLYFAITNQCAVFDAASGTPLATFSGPAVHAHDEWGFIAVQGGLLFGTKQPAGASFRTRNTSWTSRS